MTLVEQIDSNQNAYNAMKEFAETVYGFLLKLCKEEPTIVVTTKEAVSKPIRWDRVEFVNENKVEYKLVLHPDSFAKFADSLMAYSEAVAIDIYESIVKNTKKEEPPNDHK